MLKDPSDVPDHTVLLHLTHTCKVGSSGMQVRRVGGTCLRASSCKAKQHPIPQANNTHASQVNITHPPLSNPIICVTLSCPVAWVSEVENRGVKGHVGPSGPSCGPMLVVVTWLRLWSRTSPVCAHRKNHIRFEYGRLQNRNFNIGLCCPYTSCWSLP